MRPPSASGCGRWPRSPRPNPVEAASLARENGWDRRLERATRAFDRPTRVTHERALRLLARDSFSVSELERMASCSAAWFVERYLRPSTIDKQIDRMLRGSILHAALQRFYVRLPSAIPGADRVTEANVEAAVALMRECVIDAVETGLRIEAGDLDRRELEQGLQRDLEQLVRDEAASASPLVPRHLEVSFRSFELEPGVGGERQDRPRRRRADGRAGHRDRLQVGRAPRRPPTSAIATCSSCRSTCSCCAGSSGSSRVGGVYVPVGGGRRPRGMLRAGPTRCRASAARLPRAGRLRRGGRGGPGDRRRPRRADPRRGRPPRPAGRRVPALVRLVADLQEGSAVRALAERRSSARRSRRTGTCSSRPARARARPPCSSRGSSAAVVDDGLDVDSLLVITYTERAAGELRARIRAALLERGRPDLALELDGAWVSTIHGFCRRLLGAYPLAAGVDPSFRVLDEPQALVLQAEAFAAALERFCAADEPDRWQLLATYGAVGLRQMLVEVYATLRSAGRELVLESGRARAAAGADRRRSARLPTALRDDAQATDAAAGGRRRGARARSGRRRCPSACSPSATSRRAGRAPRRSPRRATRSSPPRSRSSPRATASSCRSC